MSRYNKDIFRKKMVVIDIEVKVYLDMVFIINFVFDLAGIYLTSVVGEVYKRKKRFVLAALMYASVDVVVYVIGISNNVWMFISTYLVAEILGMWISFGKDNLKNGERINIKKYILLMILHIGILCTMGGMITAVYNRVVMYKNNGVAFSELFVISILVCLLLKYLMPLIIKGIYYRERIYRVTIKLKEQEITVLGLLDTGNALIEPTTGKQVTVVEKEILKEFSNIHIKKLYLIPYSSIGKENGVLYGIRVDKLVIAHANFEKVTYDAIIGIYNGKLSVDNRYNAILHGKCLM